MVVAVPPGPPPAGLRVSRSIPGHAGVGGWGNFVQGIAAANACQATGCAETFRVSAPINGGEALILPSLGRAGSGECTPALYDTTDKDPKRLDASMV